MEVFSVARVQISLSDDVLLLVDEAAKKAGLNRSNFLSMVSMKYIEAEKKIPLASAALARLAGRIDDVANGRMTSEEFKKSVNDDPFENQMSFVDMDLVNEIRQGGSKK